MSSFNPMAAAIDWHNAYRAASLSIVDLYSDSASLECACTGTVTLVGREAIAGYWRVRFVEKPAGDLEDLQLREDGVRLSYFVKDGVVRATLAYDEAGKIRSSRCGPPSVGVHRSVSLAAALERDHYIWDLQCPKCNRTGIARVSEQGVIPHLHFAVDEVGEGFRVSRLGASSLDTEIVCIACNVPA